MGEGILVQGDDLLFYVDRVSVLILTQSELIDRDVRFEARYLVFIAFLESAVEGGLEGGSGVDSPVTWGLNIGQVAGDGLMFETAGIQSLFGRYVVRLTEECFDHGISSLESPQQQSCHG